MGGSIKIKLQVWEIKFLRRSVDVSRTDRIRNEIKG